MRNKMLVPFAIATAIAMCGNVYAGEWKQDANGWRYQNEDGSWTVNAWQWIDGNGDNIAECYYFDAYGYLLTGMDTPDGCTVNNDGAWVENGVVQTKNMAADPVSNANQGASASSGNEAGSYQFYSPVLIIKGYAPIYTAPQTDSPVLKYAYRGEAYLVLEDSGNGWYKIKYDGGEFYVQKDWDVEVQHSIHLEGGLSTARVNAVLHAYQMLGNKYTFGGSNDATGYDCTSLLQKIFKDSAGISLPRMTKEQIKQGTPIDANDLKPGDIIFYGDGSSQDESMVKHVGIYVGNDQVIHAQGTGFGVTRMRWYDNPNYIKFVKLMD